MLKEYYYMIIHAVQLFFHDMSYRIGMIKRRYDNDYKECMNTSGCVEEIVLLFVIVIIVLIALSNYYYR